jgi:hypothetical protein
MSAITDIANAVARITTTIIGTSTKLVNNLKKAEDTSITTDDGSWENTLNKAFDQQDTRIAKDGSCWRLGKTHILADEQECRECTRDIPRSRTGQTGGSGRRESRDTKMECGYLHSTESFNDLNALVKPSDRSIVVTNKSSHIRTVACSRSCQIGRVQANR